MDFCKSCYTPLDDGEEYCKTCMENGSMEKEQKKRDKLEKKEEKKEVKQKAKQPRKTKKPKKMTEKELQGLLHLGALHVKSGNFTEAIKFWELYVKDKPDDYMVWSNLATIYVKLNQPMKVVHCLRMALKADPFHSLEWDRLGCILADQVARDSMDGRPINQEVFNEAIECFNKCLFYDKYNHKVYVKMGVLYMSIKDFKKAKEYVDKYLEENPNNEEVQDIRRKIEQELNMSSSIQCPSCGTPLEENLKFCTECGLPVKKSTLSCISCGAPIEKNTKFCVECGQPVKLNPELSS